MKRKKRGMFCLLCAAVWLLAACGSPNTETPDRPDPGNDPSDVIQSEEKEVPANVIRVEGATIALTYLGGKEIDIRPEEVKAYMDLTEEKEQSEFLVEHEGQNFDYMNTEFSWASDGYSEYAAKFADNPQMNNAFAVTAVAGKFTKTLRISRVGLFVPGKTYYWQVTSNGGTYSHIDTFTVKDTAVRILTSAAAGSFNVRDAGGWKTQDGKKIAYEKIYRGGRLNVEVKDEGLRVLKEELGIKSEIDLRSARDDGGQTENAIDASYPYCKNSLAQYCGILPKTTGDDWNYDAGTPAALRNIFVLLADERNYPVYVHCNAGADRTGTLLYLINGLCGVSYADLTRDYEITSFSVQGKRWRSAIANGAFDPSGVMQNNADNYVAWGKMHSALTARYAVPDGKLSDAVENYLKTVCGVTNEQIASVRRIMTA